MTNTSSRLELLQGTLDLLILRTLAFGSAHGHAIASQIKQLSHDVLQVETGSLYPALHRLEAQGFVNSEWKTSDRGKRAKFYRLTRAGRKHLGIELSKWEKLSAAMANVLRAGTGTE